MYAIRCYYAATTYTYTITDTKPDSFIITGSMLLIRRPKNSIDPPVTSPFSTFSKPEMAFRVVVLPAPFPPASATVPTAPVAGRSTPPRR